MTIEFDWKSGVAAKDWSKTKEIELKKLYDTVSAIHEEMFYLRERDEEMQELNKETNSKMATLSFFSLLLCLSVAGLQIWHLKSFFESKKLL
ncbi:transmembrane emp24 domain-containing protein p24delta8-like [Gossypium raimondii]|nr:transmembrane emp24 domain-containing protein p24delta8-like [Gossypium raimondii]